MLSSKELLYHMEVTLLASKHVVNVLRMTMNRRREEDVPSLCAEPLCFKIE